MPTVSLHRFLILRGWPRRFISPVITRGASAAIWLDGACASFLRRKTVWNVLDHRESAALPRKQVPQKLTSAIEADRSSHFAAASSVSALAVTLHAGDFGCGLEQIPRRFCERAHSPTATTASATNASQRVSAANPAISRVPVPLHCFDLAARKSFRGSASVPVNAEFLREWRESTRDSALDFSCSAIGNRGEWRPR